MYTCTYLSAQEVTVTEVRTTSAALERELAAANASLQSVRQQSELHAAQAEDARRRLSESAKLVASNQEVKSMETI